MKLFTDVNDPEISVLLQNGAIGVLKTDTLYGIVALASNQQAVGRVYAVKGRDDTKSPIVLIASKSQLFDEAPSYAEPVLASHWPGPVSIILPAIDAPTWLTRGNKSVAYRMPDTTALRTLLAKTGCLIAPSANPQAETPATTIKQAIHYFSDRVDFYVDGGAVLHAEPSKLITINPNGTVTRLR